MISLAEISKEVYLRVDQEKDSGIPPMTKSGAFELTKAIFDIMSQALTSGESVAVPKFGKFNVVRRDKRKGRNPHTGESIDIPAKNALVFKPSSVLRTSIAESKVKSAPKKDAKDEAAGKKKKKKKKKK